MSVVIFKDRNVVINKQRYINLKKGYIHILPVHKNFGKGPDPLISLVSSMYIRVGCMYKE